MNDIESAIFQFISQWYDSFNCDNLYSKSGKLYQIIQPSEILERYWFECDSWGYDRFGALEDIGNEQYSTDDIIDGLLGNVGLVFSMISDIRDRGYFIRSIIDLSDIVPVNSLQYVMIEYAKRKPKKIKICSYKGLVKYTEEFELEDCMDEWDPVLIDEDYNNYLYNVNEWVFCNSGKPEDDSNSNFYYCKYEDLPYFFEHLRPELLTPDLLACRKQLQSYSKNGKTKTLGELATIVYPRKISDERSYFLNDTFVSAVRPRGIGKDVSIEDGDLGFDDHKSVVSYHARTDTQLHKGDYYMPSSYVFMWCPIFEEPAVPLYAMEGSCVIKVKKDISLEYLFMYFETDVGKIAVDILSTKNSVSYLPDENIELIQIVLPQKDKIYYKNMLSDLYYNDYHSIKNHLTYRQQAELYGTGLDDDLLLIKKFQLANLGCHTNLRRMILLDIEEVHRCIKVEAYKAAIILCGGILESVLMDWVSEIDNVDYFGEKVYDRNRRINLYGSEKKCFHDKDGKASNIDLYKLIERIKWLEPPVWINDEAQYATIIRENRNKVHASLAISDPVITKEECEKVLEYLTKVLDTRGLIV